MVTGVSSGIGLATALELGQRGYHVVAAGRSEQRTRETVYAIEERSGSAEYLHVDLASLDSCAAAASTFTRSSRSLDVLIANAGVGGTRGVTKDGFEIHFGVNHLGHFMLAHHLGETLVPGGRVVVVSSEMHRHADGIDFDKVIGKSKSIAGWSEYAVSKLANILFARRLARLRPEWRTYSVHPGVAKTGIFPAWVRPFLRNERSTEEAAETNVWCATSDEIADQTGLYYARTQVREPSQTAQDETLAAELWERSEQWCGIG